MYIALSMFLIRRSQPISLIPQKVICDFLDMTLLDHLRDNGAVDGHLYLTR